MSPQSPLAQTRSLLQVAPTSSAPGFLQGSVSSAFVAVQETFSIADAHASTSSPVIVEPVTK
jgi:hypothetical protein